MKIGVSIGDTYTFSKTVGEFDVYGFAGITGDFAPHHVSDAYMKNSAFGKRIAHGALMVGFMSTVAGMAVMNPNAGTDSTAVSLGYDRIRFLEPVFFGDTITVEYKVSVIEEEQGRSYADLRIVNQDNKLVAIGTHILKWVANP